ncbi:MAG: polyribonucleotide nucleotidyltransferase [Tissierellia bacterium]|nr:polyribonucleotide nucleotidyltransferase [Tissierellia bacterium]
MKERVFRRMLAGRELEVVVGKFAPLSDATVFVSYQDTQVMVHVTSAAPREGIDFFPLSCEFQEKLYAVGRIPGSYIKREARPSEKATLASRLMDRPIRPLFPESYKNDLQIIAEVMSIDHESGPEVVAMIGASIALSLAEDIPFLGPIGAMQIGYIDGEFILNPSEHELAESDLSLIVAGTREAVLMVEAQANVVSEEKVLEAILLAHEEIKGIVDFIDEIVEETGVVKKEYVAPEINYVNKAFVEAQVSQGLTDIFAQSLDKEARQEATDALAEEMLAAYGEANEDLEEAKPELMGFFKDVEKSVMRRMIVKENHRPDGRKSHEIRQLTTETGLLRRTHGSGYFVRGQTSALSVTTLGALGDAQRLDGIELDETKRFMHHYNFPNYSVGETGPIRGPNRRAIGHGALGEKALLAVIPEEDDFPYSIRVVSEVLSSNGSSSQASICAATMSLLDAGVPLKAPVAGIAMGLIKEDEDIVVLSDIQGVEDFLGDMDFKVAGTKDGITAMQMDMKIAGIDKEVLEQALEQARQGRLHILNAMNEAISEPAELSPYAPRVFVLWIDPDKIRDVIGSGGKTINQLTADYSCKIDIDDDGRIVITAEDGPGGEGAKKAIEEITKEVEVGEVYNAKIVRIAKFGAFVELTPYHEALVHVSELTIERLENVEDKFKEGEMIEVKVIGVDDDGKIAASRKALLKAEENKELAEKMKNIAIGDVFTAKILRIAKFGAFVELVKGVDALCHISELTLKHLKRVEDEFKIGDEIVVKVISIDGDKIGVSRKALLEEAISEA